MSDQIIVSRRGLERVNDLLIEQRIGAAGTALTQIIDGAPPAEGREPVGEVVAHVNGDGESVVNVILPVGTKLYTAPADTEQGGWKRVATEMHDALVGDKNAGAIDHDRLESAVDEFDRLSALSQLTADAQQQGLYEQPITAQEAMESLWVVHDWAMDSHTDKHLRNAHRYIEQTAQGAAQDREDAKLLALKNVREMCNGMTGNQIRMALDGWIKAASRQQEQGQG